MMGLVSDMIAESGLDFLNAFKFEQITEGRFFQREKIDLGHGRKQFYVILGPNIESPIHDHVGQNMDETHLLLYGSGKFLIYDAQGKVKEELHLRHGVFHPIFSTREHSPKHTYIAGPKGSICLALETYYGV